MNSFYNSFFFNLVTHYDDHTKFNFTQLKGNFALALISFYINTQKQNTSNFYLIMSPFTRYRLIPSVLFLTIQPANTNNMLRSVHLCK